MGGVGHRRRRRRMIGLEIIEMILYAPFLVISRRTEEIAIFGFWILSKLTGLG